MRKLLEVVKNAVWEEDPKAKSPTPPAAAPAAPVGLPVATVSTVQIGSGTPDSKYMRGLEDFMKPVSSDRYLAFRRQLDVLGKIIKDAAQLFQAALASVDGLTVAEIMHEIDDCVNELDRQQREFEDGLNSRVQSSISTNETAIAKITADIEGLNRQIKELETRREALQREVTEVQTHTSAERSAFGGALAAHRTQLADLKSKVSQYLSTGGVS